MRYLVSLLSLMLLTLVFKADSVHQVSAQSRYRYAYLVAESATTAQIALINPARINDPPEFRELPLPLEWRTPVVRNISPKGDWSIFISASLEDSSTEIRHIRVYNFTTGETRDLETGYLLNTINAPEYSIAWSSDNRYIALNITHDRLQHDVIVHSLENGNTMNLTRDAADQRGVIWSPDSSKVATFTTQCPTIENCSQTIQIIDIHSNMHQHSRIFGEYAPNTLGLGCQLAWAPSGNVISFIAGCDQSPSIEREVFTYDLINNELEQITTFTSQIFEPDRFQFSQAQYATTWLDANNLLIGASYQTDPNAQPITQSLLYESVHERLTPIFDQYAEQWAINPVTNQIAARLISPPNSIQTNVRDIGGVQIFSLSSSQINSGERIIEELHLPLGCDLAWSPDGSILAYTTRGISDCVGTTQQILFFTATTQLVQEHIPTLETGTRPYAVIPMGWILY